MLLEKNPKTRPLYRRLLALEDKVAGRAFPKMTRVKQIHSSYCGPAVLASLYSNFGKKVSQKGIMRSLRLQKKIIKDGLNIRELARASRIIGKGEFSFWRKANATIGNLDNAVNKHTSPVAVEWQGIFYEYDDGDIGHYSIVTKIDKIKGFLRMADSYSAFTGVDRKFKIKVFEKRWWDENDISVDGTSKKRRIRDNKVMFLITKKGETWPKKLGMTRI